MEQPWWDNLPEVKRLIKSGICGAVIFCQKPRRAYYIFFSFFSFFHVVLGSLCYPIGADPSTASQSTVSFMTVNLGFAPLYSLMLLCVPRIMYVIWCAVLCTYYIKYCTLHHMRTPTSLSQPNTELSDWIYSCFSCWNFN